MVCIFAATLANLSYHQLLADCPYPVSPQLITVIRDINCLLYQFTMLIYVDYILRLVLVTGRERRRIRIVAGVGFITFAIFQLLGHFFHYGFYVDSTGELHNGARLSFAIAFIFFTSLIFYLLFRYRNRMIPQLTTGITLTFVLCIFMMILQGKHGQTSYTSTIFMMPVIGFMYLLHSNPYDLATGSVSGDSLSYAVRDCYRSREKFVLMYLDVVEMSSQQKIPEEMSFDIYRFYRSEIKKPLLFHLSANRLLLMFKVRDNKDPWTRVDKVVKMFALMYERHRLDFKAVFMDSVDSLSRDNEYIEFLKFVANKTGYNEFHYVKDEDITEYEEQKKLLKELEAIAEKGDLNDERVLAYCQPVYNVESGRYDTAEALMRLKLPESGIVPPYLFIPLAEKNNLIHPLSLIILNKTCLAIRSFLDEGLPLKRISVNFSIQEIRDENFCSDVTDIIKANGIPYEKIAIEITESRNERDFDMVKEKIEQLKAYGIKFYLDDFGTGYSNFERIMELPFDIIKFDRSLVIESGKNKEGEYMVDTFASMFRKLNYRVLYEGIETENDESRCINMSAQYLQGFKYSKPVEMDTLRAFLSKAS
ncbi:MAG: EAL domain-containing protein [Lachnospiraceae bacterium]|nr:EAL domain-containing protein [Lachnospiraceae bacterium]